MRCNILKWYVTLWQYTTFYSDTSFHVIQISNLDKQNQKKYSFTIVKFTTSVHSNFARVCKYKRDQYIMHERGH